MLAARTGLPFAPSPVLEPAADGEELYTPGPSPESVPGPSPLMAPELSPESPDSSPGPAPYDQLAPGSPDSSPGPAPNDQLAPVLSPGSPNSSPGPAPYEQLAPELSPTPSPADLLLPIPTDGPSPSPEFAPTPGPGHLSQFVTTSLSISRLTARVLEHPAEGAASCTCVTNYSGAVLHFCQAVTLNYYLLSFPENPFKQ